MPILTLQQNLTRGSFGWRCLPPTRATLTFESIEKKRKREVVKEEEGIKVVEWGRWKSRGVCVCLWGGGLLARVFTIKPKTLKRKRALPNYKGKANRAGVKSLLKSHHFFTSFLSFSSPLPSISFFLPGFLIASTFQQDWLSGKTLITGPDLSIRAGGTRVADSSSSRERRQRWCSFWPLCLRINNLQ